MVVVVQVVGARARVFLRQGDLLMKLGGRQAWFVIDDGCRMLLWIQSRCPRGGDSFKSIGTGDRFGFDSVLG